MSESDPEATAALPRSVGRAVGMHPDAEMTAIGLVLFVVVLPLRPFLLVVRLAGTLSGSGGPAT